MEQSSDPFGLIVAEPARASRRRILLWLGAVPAALGLAVFAEHDAVEAGKKKRKKKRKKNNGGSGSGGSGSGGGYSGGGDAGGGGSAAYAPDGEEQAFLSLINAYRGQKGAGPLSLQTQLGAASENHAQVMAGQNNMVHNANVQAYLLLFGYPAVSWGENIAAGYDSASQVFDAWKKSPTHNQNMLDGGFTEIGIGRAYNPGSSYGWYWTTEFGRR